MKQKEVTLEGLDKKIDRSIGALDKKVNKILEILDGHSKMLQSHSKMLQSHSKMLQSHSKMHESHTKMLEKHSMMHESHTDRLNGHDIQLERLVSIVLDHSERLDRIEIQVKKIDNLPTRKDLDKLFARLDEQIGTAKIIDQERVMTRAAIRRHDDKIENNTKDIKKIKMHLALD